MRCVAVLVLLLALGACGDGAEDAATSVGSPGPTSAVATPTSPEPTRSEPTPPEPTPPEPAPGGPEAAYRAWLAALAAHDAKATCARHAPDYTIALRFEAVLLDRAELGDPCVGFVAVLWEQPEREYEPLEVEVTQETAEDALLAVDFADADVTVELERRNGSWFVLAERRRNQPLPPGADPERWVESWCDLELTMSSGELIDLMGPPSLVYTIGDGGEPQLVWTQDQYDFRAYLDTDPPRGTTIDLVGDYDRLSGTERAGLDCPELR